MWLRLIADRAAAAVATEGRRAGRESRSTSAAGLSPGFRFSACRLPGVAGLRNPGRGRPRRHGYRLQGAPAQLAASGGHQGGPPRRAREEQIIARFHQERLLAGRLAHPNLVAAYDAGAVAGLPYFVMEFVEGTGLDALVRAARPVARGGGLRGGPAGGPRLAAHSRTRPGPPRRQAVQPHAHAFRPGEGARPGPGAAGERVGPGRTDHVARPVPGHPRLHGPRAVRQQPHGRYPRRHLQPGLHAVPPAGGRPAVRRLLVPVPEAQGPCGGAGAADPRAAAGRPRAPGRGAGADAGQGSQWSVRHPGGGRRGCCIPLRSVRTCRVFCRRSWFHHSRTVRSGWRRMVRPGGARR